MSKIYKTYLKAIEKNIKAFAGNWLPGTPRQLGDYGTYKNGIFERIGNINDLDISFDVVGDDLEDKYSFTSGATLDFTGAAAATAGAAAVKASVSISFSKSDMVYFNAIGCKTTGVGNIDKMEEAIRAGDKADKFKWKNSYHVITSLVTSSQTVVAISTSNSASISFAAKSPEIARVNLADASCDLALAGSKDVGFSVDAEKGLQVLFNVTKVRGTFA